MSYLYGDSTPSQLETNYIEFLRDAMDLMVAVLLADHQSRATLESVRTARSQAEKELESLHDFSVAVNAMLDGSTSGLDPKAPTGQCAAAVRTAATEEIRKAANQIKQALQGKSGQLEAQIKRDRASCNSAIEAFLLRHDLPGTVHRLELRLDADEYLARLSGSSKEALSWVVDLEIPSGNLFSSVVRLDRVVDHLEIQLPEESGWVRKTTKLRNQKLTNKYITGLVHTTGESTLKLRVSPTDETGYDIVISRGQVKVVSGGDPFDPTPDDAAKLVQLYKDVFAAASEVSKKRSRLVDARIDGKSLADHDNPAILVQRMIGRMAPTVQEIARHSLSPSELVLKRVLANDRREEIFVSKADLLKKIDTIPLELRGIFAPLGLGNLDPANAPPAPRRPGPTIAPEPAPRGFRTHPPPGVGDDEDTKVAVSSSANGKIKLQQNTTKGPPPTPTKDAAGDESLDIDIDDAIASLDTEAG